MAEQDKKYQQLLWREKQVCERESEPIKKIAKFCFNISKYKNNPLHKICTDYEVLEVASTYYNAFNAKEISIDEIICRVRNKQKYTLQQKDPAELFPDELALVDKYKITQERLLQCKSVAEKLEEDSGKKYSVEGLIKICILDKPERYDKAVVDRIRAEQVTQKQPKTQEKIEPKTVIPKGKTDTKKGSPKGK